MQVLRVLIFVILVAGTVDIGQREWRKNTLAWERVIDQVFVVRRDCAIAIKEYGETGRLRFALRIASFRQDKVEDCYRSASTARLNEQESFFPAETRTKTSDMAVLGRRLHRTPLTRRFFGAAWLDVESHHLALRSLINSDEDWLHLEATRACTVASTMAHTFLFGGILLVNFVVVSLEDWLKAIPARLD